jgi:hypothetical protein
MSNKPVEAAEINQFRTHESRSRRMSANGNTPAHQGDVIELRIDAP